MNSKQYIANRNSGAESLYTCPSLIKKTHDGSMTYIYIYHDVCKKRMLHVPVILWRSIAHVIRLFIYLRKNWRRKSNDFDHKLLRDVKFEIKIVFVSSAYRAQSITINTLDPSWCRQIDNFRSFLFFFFSDKTITFHFNGVPRYDLTFTQTNE